MENLSNGACFKKKYQFYLYKVINAMPVLSTFVIFQLNLLFFLSLVDESRGQH